MAITFKPQMRKNPQDVEAPAKFYASSIASGETDFETLAGLISYQSTLTESDCLAVLSSLEHNIMNELKQGRIVKLGRLGNFQVSISSEGSDTADEVSANKITKKRILFRPGKRLRNLLNDLSFRNAS